MKFDPIIKGGHNDLYFMVQLIYSVSWMNVILWDNESV